eukprot:XP_001708102.1 Hypothetical protein GL50803_25618 [Giardia lamblia ATCC 50803]
MPQEPAYFRYWHEFLKDYLHIVMQRLSCTPRNAFIDDDPNIALLVSRLVYTSVTVVAPPVVSPHESQKLVLCIYGFWVPCVASRSLYPI